MKEVMTEVQEVQWKLGQSAETLYLILEKLDEESSVKSPNDERITAYCLLSRMPQFLSALYFVASRLGELKEQIDKAVELGYTQSREIP